MMHLVPRLAEGRLESSLCVRPRPNSADLGARSGGLRLALKSWLSCQKLIVDLCCRQPSSRYSLPGAVPHTGSFLALLTLLLLRIHFFSQCSLSILLIPSILLGARDETVNKTDKNSFS